MAKNQSASAKTLAGAAVREARLRGGHPLYIQDSTEEPAWHDSHPFRSSSPIMAHVLDTDTELSTLENKYHSAVRQRARRLRVHRFRHLHPKFMAALPRGAISLSLYALLFANERQVLEISVNYWWSFMVPVSIALVFSIAHGSFTAAFWDAMGLQPNTIRK